LLSIIGGASAALGVLASLAACGTTATTTGVTPITGIVIRSDSLVSGLGCGPGAHQVYKYVAAVASDDAPTTYLYANAFNCYADGDFSTIPIPDSGNPSFTVMILALDKDAYDAQASSVDGIFGKPQGDPTHPIAIAGIAPTWTTTCHATQQQSVAVLAVCDPLAATTPPPPPADAGSTTRIQLDTASFPKADGGSFVCGTDFTTLRALFDQFPNQTGAIDCPAPLVIDPAKSNVTYHLDITLTKGTNTVAIASGCTATTTPGQTTTPTCPAFQ
jgi:hypothetical protein